MQNWHENQDVGNLTSTILIHLSKAYDNLTPWLSLPKLEASDFIIESLQLIQNCISFRKQQVKIGGFFRRWVEILFGIPEGSILGPILFNIFISVIFFFVKQANICSFTDDNTLYTSGNNEQVVVEKVMKDCTRIID